MKLSEIVSALKGKVLTGGDGPDLELTTGCGCDLMSDVLAFSKPGGLLLTGLINPQAIRTAEMAEINVICFVRGKLPSAEMIALAREKDIVLIITELPLFEACGVLYKRGLVGCFDNAQWRDNGADG